MAEYDFFDLTSLKFDPPDKIAAVKAAISDLEKELNASLPTESNVLKQKETKEKLAFIESTKKKYSLLTKNN